MKTYKVTLDENCKLCHGTGEVNDRVDCGELCSCVTEQIPEKFVDMSVKLELTWE